MTNETNLKLTVETGEAIKKMDAFTQSATAAANAVERLDKAWASLSETLKTLNGSPHGGISFQMVSEVARAEIKPAGGSKPPTLHAGGGTRPHQIFLDGQRIKHVIACDPEEGYVLVDAAPGEEFAPVAFNGGAYKRLDGVVTFVMP